MELYNSTSYKYKAIIDGKECDLPSKSSVHFDYNEGMKVDLISLDKPWVHINWLDVIILQMFFGSTTYTRMYSDYSFVINEECDRIELGYNDWSVRDQININTVYAKSNVTDEEYRISNFDKVKKKHKRLHMLVSNAWPIGVGTLLACFLTDPPHLFIVLFLVWLIVFEIPSLKEIKRFNQVIKFDFINEKLCEYAQRRRVETITITDDTSKTGKIVGKILDKMFKFDEDKEQ